MKKLFLFVGVILWCLIYSCKKDNPPPPPPPPIDSFLLHPPPVLDSLPIPLTIGTWWKYQRIDSSIDYSNSCLVCGISSSVSSTELITVIGKTSIVDSAQETISPWRKRYDTVESFVLEVKNLTKGTLDTSHAYYYNASFYMRPNKDGFGLNIYMPFFEGNSYVIPNQPSPYTAYVNNNISITVLNQNFDSCINYYNSYGHFYGAYGESSEIKTYLKPGVGFVDWAIYYSYTSHYGNGKSSWYSRKLLDYHIAP